MKHAPIQYGTVEATAVVGEGGTTATITGKYHAGELTYVKVNYEIRHRTDTTNLADLSSIFNATPIRPGKRNFSLENPDNDGVYHVIERYSVVKPVDDIVRQLFLSLV